MEPLRIESSQPGTLLWIGPTAHGEFADAFRYCRDHVAQIAVRKSLRAALLRPAGFVRRVIIARPTRQVPRRAAWDRLTALYSHASSLALCSSLCDGEGRTGTPWPADAIRFSRWTEWLPGWLAPCGIRDKRRQRPSSLLVISDRFEMAEPYLQAANGISLTAHWQRCFIPALHAGFDTVLWDDSAACPADATTWRLRLGARSDAPVDLEPAPTAPGRRTSADKSPPQPQHFWLALHPSIDAIQQAHDGGIAKVLTKPARINSIFD